MTCIAGLVEDERVYMGADSVGSDGHRYDLRSEPKIFKRRTNHGEFIFGYTTSFRFGQLLQHSLRIPPHPKRFSDHKYMVTHFIDAVRECFKKGGWLHKKDEVESGGTALIGYHGQLWEMGGSFQIALVSKDGYGVVGSGIDGAKGALYILQRLDLPPKERIMRALMAAEATIMTVRGPFRIMSGAVKP